MSSETSGGETGGKAAAETVFAGAAIKAAASALGAKVRSFRSISAAGKRGRELGLPGPKDHLALPTVQISVRTSWGIPASKE